MIEWFMLLAVLYMLRTWAMVTLLPSPEGSECNANYQFEENWDILKEAFKIYIYRNRVCYGLVFDVDLINTTVLGLLVVRYFDNWGIRLVYLVLWLLNIFTILMLRVSYTMSLYLSVVVPCLLFVIFHYETKYNEGLFGVMLKEEMEYVPGDVMILEPEFEDVVEDVVDIHVISEEEVIEEIEEKDIEMGSDVGDMEMELR